MKISLVGISFSSLPVAVREDFSLSAEEQEKAPVVLKEVFRLEEIVCVYTCNRIEFYYIENESVNPYELFCYFTELNGSAVSKIISNIYCYKDDEVLLHLFGVISGLKSLVLGESQIFHQIKKAFQISVRGSCVKKELHQVFSYAFKIAKEVHRVTQIDQFKSSVASVAVDLAENLSGNLNNQKVLIVGMGETAELALKSLQARGCELVWFASRSVERALIWSEVSGKETFLIKELPLILEEFSVIISCSDCKTPLIHKSIFYNAYLRSTTKRFTLIDLGVPRNIESSLGELPGVQLRNIDDLKDMISENRESREKASSDAWQIVKLAVEKFNCQKSMNLYLQKFRHDMLMRSQNLIIDALQKFSETNQVLELEANLIKIIEKNTESALEQIRFQLHKIPPAVLNCTLFNKENKTEDLIQGLQYTPGLESVGVSDEI